MDFSETDAITLRRTDYKDSSQIVAFEVQMLALLGYLPELNCCVNCEEKVSSKSISFFSALEGEGDLF